jgi:hypothetical protein
MDDDIVITIISLARPPLWLADFFHLCFFAFPPTPF